MKIAVMFIVSVFGLCILSVRIGSTGEYHFAWAPHPNERVVEFRIYYRTNSSLYNVTDFESVLISNPKFDPTRPEWKITLPDVAEEYCFTITAVDIFDLESNPIDEYGRGTSCGKVVVDNNDGGGKGGNDVGDGGGGGDRGGRCFILQGILHDKRWDE